MIVLYVLAFMALWLLIDDQRTRYKLRKLQTMSTDALTKLFADQSQFILYIRATEELVSRGEDIDFIHPVFESLLTARNPAIRLLAKRDLELYFPENSPHQ
jgi:hypothetical protein